MSLLVAQATTLLTDSLHRSRKRGNQLDIGNCRAQLGFLALLRGDIVEAYVCLQEAVTIGITSNLPVLLAFGQLWLGLVTLYGGNGSEARVLLEECLRVCLEVKNTISLAKACMCLAELSLWDGDADEAAHWLDQSLAYYSAPKRIDIAELQRFFVSARLATLQGQYQRAAVLLGFAEVAHRRMHYVYAGPMLPLVNAALSKVHEMLGNERFDEAFTAGQQLSLDDAYLTLLAPSFFESRRSATDMKS